MPSVRDVAEAVLRDVCPVTYTSEAVRPVVEAFVRVTRPV